MGIMAATEKVSVTIGKDELRRAKHVASRLGLSLSTFINDAVKERVAAQARKEAGAAVLAMFPADDRATPEEMASLLASWGSAATPPPRPKRTAGKPARRRKKSTARRSS
jgi:hypothetical protein